MDATTTKTQGDLLDAIAAEHELNPEQRAFLGPDFPAVEWWAHLVSPDTSYRGVQASWLPYGKCVDAVKFDAGRPASRVALLVIGDVVHECDDHTAIEYHGARLTVAPCEGGRKWHKAEIHRPAPHC
jgi:hypothetical protein